MFENNGQPTAYTGRVYPAKRFQRTPPVWEVKAVVGEGNSFGRFRLWCHEPTLEFDTISIFMGFSTRESAFTRITLSDLQAVKLAIDEAIEKHNQSLPALQIKSEQVRKTLEFQYNMQRMAENIQNNGHSDGQ